MRLLTLFASCSLLFLCAQHTWADEETKVSVSVSVPQGDTLTVAVPANWKHTLVQPSPKIPPTLSLSEKETGLSLRGTFIRLGEKKLSKPADVEETVKLFCQQYVGGSVEKEIKLKPINSKHGLGSYSTFTDASLVDVKEPRTGEYRTVTTGLFVIGEQAATFTLLTNDVEGEAYQAALKIVAEGITRTEPKKP